MTPAAPPLPVPRNLPFHAPVGGSHTSILMCDSGVGVSVAATRQNAGVFIGAAVAAAPGTRNVPASTGTASVIVTSGTFNAANASQDEDGVCAASGAAAKTTNVKWSAQPAANRLTVVLPSSPFS